MKCDAFGEMQFAEDLRFDAQYLTFGTKDFVEFPLLASHCCQSYAVGCRNGTRNLVPCYSFCMLQEFSGEKLRSLRKRARLTQKQVVELAGVSEACIIYLEKGKRKPQTKTLHKILSLYSMQIQYWKNLNAVLQEKEPNG